jgi:hypothetical protein
VVGALETNLSSLLYLLSHLRRTRQVRCWIRSTSDPISDTVRFSPRNFQMGMWARSSSRFALLVPSLAHRASCVAPVHWSLRVSIPSVVSSIVFSPRWESNLQPQVPLSEGLVLAARSPSSPLVFILSVVSLVVFSSRWESNLQLPVPLFAGPQSRCRRAPR